ncbi:J domain-containing protein [Aestuariivirga sp.]|uniref:J domain-containing protein n=1 Tax=Aestuariivirga sp. TaxID=2650926 RepID=UPI00391A2002
MSGLPDYYAVLGVHPAAEDEVIAAAYRALAKKYHPDAGGEVTADRFVGVQEAYEVLSNPERREAYDKARSRRENAAGTEMPPADESLRRPHQAESTRSGEAPAARNPDHWRQMALTLGLGILAIAATVLVVKAGKDNYFTITSADQDADGGAVSKAPFSNIDAKGSMGEQTQGNSVPVDPNEVSAAGEETVQKMTDRILPGPGETLPALDDISNDPSPFESKGDMPESASTSKKQIMDRLP